MDLSLAPTSWHFEEILLEQAESVVGQSQAAVPRAAQQYIQVGDAQSAIASAPAPEGPSRGRARGFAGQERSRLQSGGHQLAQVESAVAALPRRSAIAVGVSGPEAFVV